MTVVAAISMCKDEADIVESSIRHMAGQVDFLIVADNLSTDGSRDILGDLAKSLPLTVINDTEIAYYQSAKVTAMAHLALARGADWIVPWDQDELWYGDGGTIKDVLADANADVAVSQVWRHLPRHDMPVGNPHETMPWREPDPERFGSVAFRPRPGMVVKQGNHDVIGVGGVRVGGLLSVREFQYRSLGQMVRKVRNGKAAYDATNLNEYEGAHWRRLGALSDEQLAAEWRYLCDLPAVHDPAPVTWQTA